MSFFCSSTGVDPIDRPDLESAAHRYPLVTHSNYKIGGPAKIAKNALKIKINVDQMVPLVPHPRYLFRGIPILEDIA